MLKKLIAAVLLMVALPVLANATWFLNTQARSSGGTIQSTNMAVPQTVLDGPVYRTYTTSANIPVTVQADSGFAIRYLVINGDTNHPLYPDKTKGQDTSWTYTFPGSYDDKSLAATFIPSALSVTASVPGGSATPASLGNIAYGYTVVSPIIFYFTPPNGGEITGIANVPTDTHVTTSGFSLGTGKRVWVKFDTGYVFDTSLSLTATVINTTPLLNRIPAQNTIPGGTVNLSASGNNLPADAVFTWTYVSGPKNTSTPNYTSAGKYSGITVVPGPAIAAFTAYQVGTTVSFVAPSDTGQYKFLLHVTSSSTPALNLTALAAVNCFASVSATAQNQCQFCHSANKIGPQTPNGPRTLYLNWSSSMHKANSVMCANCHVGASTAGHPGVLIGGMVSEKTFAYTAGGNSFCLNGTCHNVPDTVKEFLTHKTVGITCANCHFSGEIHNINANLADDMSNNVCFKCHGLVNTTHYFTKVTLANDCLKCHNNGWNPHFQTKATFFPVGVVVPPQHFNGYTSYVNPNYAAAYVTAATSCSNCHKGGDPNDTTVDKTDLMKQYRHDWYSSAHGDVKGVAWLNSATHNWKASGMAGVNLAQAGNPTDCQRCHTAKGFALFNISSSITPIDATAPVNSEPLTCNGCHNPDFTVRNISARTAYYNYSSKATGKLLVSAAFPDSGYSNVCLGCHMGRQSGKTFTAITSALVAAGTTSANNYWGNVGFINSHYLAAGGEVFRTIGYEYPGMTYSNGVDHSLVGSGTGDGPCVTCHMQPSGLATHSHSLNPAVAGYAVCKSCHSQSVSNFDTDFPGFVQGKKDDFNSALAALAAALTQKGFTPSDNYPYFSNKNWGDRSSGPGTMGAAFNYNQLKHDPGAFAHNPTYVKRLVRDSIDFLTSADHSVDRSRSLTTTIASLGLSTSDQTNATAFVFDSGNGSSACAVCHSATTDPVHNDPIVSTYNNSIHATAPGGASCADCHLPTGTTSMAHPPQFNMYSSAAFIDNNCWNCHTKVNPAFGQSIHTWPSQGLCTNCHNPHNPWPPAMNIYPHFSTYSTAQYITASAANNNTGTTCNNCHYQASVNVFTVYSANHDWAKSSHGNPQGVAYIGPGPITEANLEAYDFKFRGTAGATTANMATNTSPASAAKDDCVRCHTYTGYVNYVNPSDPSTALTNVAPFGVKGDRAREMVSCPTCHTPTPFSDTFSRRAVGIESSTVDAGGSTVVAFKTWFNYSSLATAKFQRSKYFFYTDSNGYYWPPGDSNICISCHSGKAAGDVIKQITGTNCSTAPTIACRFGAGNQTAGSTSSSWGNVDFVDAHDGTTANLMFPDSLRPGYEYRAPSPTPSISSTVWTPTHDQIGYSDPNATTPAGPCVGCHMSSANIHTFKVLSTSSTGVIGNVRSTVCANCHFTGGTAFAFGTSPSDFSVLQGKLNGYNAALSVIKAQLAAKNINYNASLPPYFFNTSVAANQSNSTRVTNWIYNTTYQGADLMGAASNLRLLDSDNGWVHNGTYTRRILFDTIGYLGNGPVTNGVYTTTQVTNAINAVSASLPAGTTTTAINYVTPRP